MVFQKIEYQAFTVEVIVDPRCGITIQEKTITMYLEIK